MKAKTVDNVERPPFLLHRLLGVIDLSTISSWHIDDEPEGTFLRASRPGIARLGGLFDIFPESYWSRFTTLRNVNFRCHVTGPITIRLLRRQVDGSSEICLEEREVVDAAATEIVLTATLADPAAPESYLLIEAIAADAGASLQRATWETNQPPLHEPRIGVAITTYNRETFLAANLSRLRGRLAGGRMIIVNHGAPGLESRIQGQTPCDPDVRYVDQENSGGAGGFIRGMLEHHATRDITHVLLMDDDIDLQPDLVERLTAILSFANSDLCLGGAMFDYRQRNQLFTAGDFLQPGSFGIGHIAPEGGCDILEASGVDFLNHVHHPDFNGWWCFTFPVSALKEVGLPMSCFIRGDDVEFGYRLTRASKPTVSWPGIAVWHMPFAEKSAPWHMFYDRRNNLFMNARHRRVGRLRALGKLIGGFMHHLLRYDYDRVRAMTLGIAAFNKGAQAMADWTHHDHAALIAATSSTLSNNSKEITGDTEALAPIRLTGAARSLRMTMRFLLDLFYPWRDRTPAQLPPEESWRPDGCKRPAIVIELNEMGHPAKIYCYDWRESWKAVTRCFLALTGMVVRFHQPVPLMLPDDRAPIATAGHGSERPPIHDIRPAL